MTNDSGTWAKGKPPASFEKLWRGLALVGAAHLAGMLVNIVFQMLGNNSLDGIPAKFLGFWGDFGPTKPFPEQNHPATTNRPNGFTGISRSDDSERLPNKEPQLRFGPLLVRIQGWLQRKSRRCSPQASCLERHEAWAYIPVPYKPLSPSGHWSKESLLISRFIILSEL